jgi:hypothetical protein
MVTDDKTAGSTVSVTKVLYGDLGDGNNFLSRDVIPKRREVLRYVRDRHSRSVGQ